MKKAILICIMLVLMPLIMGTGGHNGEPFLLAVNISFRNYQGLDNGVPYYYKGDDISYIVSIKNNGARTYNNYLCRTIIETLDGTLIATSEWESCPMSPGEKRFLGMKVYANAEIGNYRVLLELRHTNQGSLIAARMTVLGPGFYVVINPGGGK